MRGPIPMTAVEAGIAGSGGNFNLTSGASGGTLPDGTVIVPTRKLIIHI